MLRVNRWLPLGILAWALASNGVAHAGPVELINDVSISGTTPKNMVVPFTYGGNGLLISNDGGETLSWLCAAGVATTANNRNATTFMSGDDHIYLGMLDGLFRGNADGCGFERVPELEKRYIRAIAGDPIDPKRTYVGTSNSMMDNFIYMSDGTAPFAPLGAATPLWIDSLHVVKSGESRRFYQTAVTTDLMTNQVTYMVRVSDDEAKTWTEDKVDLIDPADKMSPQFSIVAVDPQNPDHVLGHIWRTMTGPDQLVLSKEKGKTGTWKMIAEMVELGGVSFTPSGAIYYGESDSAMRGLYVIESEGAAPKRLNQDTRVFCVKYDDTNKRLLGCANNYWFGTFDMTSGALTPMIDLRCAEHSVKCADKPEIQDLCQPPGVEFCKLDHWLLAPLCKVYDRGPDFCEYAAAQSFQCEGGKVVDKEEGRPIAECAAGGGSAGTGSTSEPLMSGGAAGSSTPAAAGSSAPPATAAGGSSAAANSGKGGSGGSTAGAGSDKSGCSCSTLGSASDKTNAGSTVLLALLMGSAWLVRRRRIG